MRVNIRDVVLEHSHLCPVIMPCARVEFNFNVTIIDTLHKALYIHIFKNVCIRIVKMLNVIQDRFIKLYK